MSTNLSKVDKIRLMLEAAEAEEGQLDDFKKYARDKLLTGAWIIDKEAVFGLETKDKVCVINDAGDVCAAAITSIETIDMCDDATVGEDDDGTPLDEEGYPIVPEVYLCATYEWIDADGDECSGYISSYDDTVYVKLLK